MAVAEPISALIVGAGPTGLALAAALAHHSVRCRVIDRERTRAQESRALAVQARTLEVLHAIDADEPMLARGLRVRAGNFHFLGSGRTARIEFDRLETAYPFVLSLPQSATESILAEKAARAGVAIDRGVELIGLRQDGEKVEATMRDDDGREEKLTAPWLIGCDGAHSTVRNELGVAFRGASYDEEFWLADLRVTWRETAGELHAFLGEGAFAAVPMADMRHRLILTAEGEERGGRRQPSLDDVRRLASRLGPADLELSDPVWISRFHIHRRMAERLRVGRVLLAGDAIHVHSPVGGQGMNTGIQDAWNLAWKLALVIRGFAGMELLDSYEIERGRLARAVLRATDLATRAVLPHSRVLRTLRDWIAPHVLALSAVRDLAVRQISELAIHDRESPIVLQRAPTTSIHAGDRMPDALLRHAGRECRLHDFLRDPRHTAFWLSAGAEQRIEGGHELASLLAHQVIAPEGSSFYRETLCDLGGELHRRLGVSEPALLVMRPDGQVGLVAIPPTASAIDDYFARLRAGRG